MPLMHSFIHECITSGAPWCERYQREPTERQNMRTLHSALLRVDQWGWAQLG